MCKLERDHEGLITIRSIVMKQIISPILFYYLLITGIGLGGYYLILKTIELNKGLSKTRVLDLQEKRGYSKGAPLTSLRVRR